MSDEENERAALAEKLRHYGRDELKDGSLLRTLKDVTGGATWRDCLLRLADMADPVCSNVGGGEWPFRCSACGGHTTEFDHMFPPPEAKAEAERMLRDALDLADDCRIVSAHSSEPRYCPWCGARVVEVDE